MGTHLPSPSPRVVPVNAYVLGCLPRKESIFVSCPWGSFMAALPEEAGQRLSAEKMGEERVALGEDLCGSYRNDL